jgi:hypothetical protein
MSSDMGNGEPASCGVDSDVGDAAGNGGPTAAAAESWTPFLDQLDRIPLAVPTADAECGPGAEPAPEAEAEELGVFSSPAFLAMSQLALREAEVDTLSFEMAQLRARGPPAGMLHGPPQPSGGTPTREEAGHAGHAGLPGGAITGFLLSKLGELTEHLAQRTTELAAAQAHAAGLAAQLVAHQELAATATEAGLRRPAAGGGCHCVELVAGCRPRWPGGPSIARRWDSCIHWLWRRGGATYAPLGQADDGGGGASLIL